MLLEPKMTTVTPDDPLLSSQITKDDEIDSSDLSYLSDIEEESSVHTSQTTPSQAGSSSALNTSQLDALSLESDTGCFILNWRAEMTPGTVSGKHHYNQDNHKSHN